MGELITPGVEQGSEGTRTDETPDSLDRRRLEKLRGISLEAALQEMGNRVYSAAIFAEQLEDAGRVLGNGHHVAQDISAYAQARILERWEDIEHVQSLGKDHPAALALAVRLRQEYSQ